MRGIFSIFLAAVLTFIGCRRGPVSESVPDPSELSGLVRTLQTSVADWNEGKLDGFVAPYDDSCTFMARSGPVGKTRMVENYQNGYFTDGKPKQILPVAMS